MSPPWQSRPGCWSSTAARTASSPSRAWKKPTRNWPPPIRRPASPPTSAPTSTTPPTNSTGRCNPKPGPGCAMRLAQHKANPNRLFENAKTRKSENAKSERTLRNPGREEARNDSFLVSWIPHRNAGPFRVFALSRFRVLKQSEACLAAPRASSHWLDGDLDPDRGDDRGGALALGLIAVVDDGAAGVVDLPGLHLRLLQGTAGRLLENEDHFVVRVDFVVEDNDHVLVQR